MKNVDINKLASLVSSFKSVRVLVVGDLILDEFIWGSVSRISPEAPIPVVWVNSESFLPGGACNVASNIRALGAKADVAGVVGNEGRGRMLLDLLKQNRINTKAIFRDSRRPTTLKTRVVAHHQQVVRIDREKVIPLDRSVESRMIRSIKAQMSRCDAVCIEDYGKGVITPNLVSQIVKIAKKNNKVITVDPKEDHLSYYKGVTSMTPNHHEASALSGIEIKDDRSLLAAGRKLMRKLGCHNILITLGENGMCLFQKGVKPVKIPTLARDVFDVSGAGDTVIGTFTLTLALGASPLEAAHIANCAAGIVVAKVGTATLSRRELIEGLMMNERNLVAN